MALLVEEGLLLEDEAEELPKDAYGAIPWPEDDDE